MHNEDAASLPAAAKTIEPPGPNSSLAGRPTVDDMGAWSFPASDPPATWTWDPVVRTENS
jgi:hypothetical protein